MSSTSTSAATSATSSNASMAASGGTFSGMSFVGNTPSTVLFFLAMAVGVGIALLFIFFTARYFTRARFGLHLYSSTHRGMMFSPRAASTYNPVEYTDREIQEHLDYLRRNHFLRDDFLERRLNAGNRRRRRRRRRGRFSKMKKLSPEEVENLFPKSRYADWLNTGDDDKDDDDNASSSSSSLSASAAKDVASAVSENAEKAVFLTSPESEQEATFGGVVEIPEKSQTQKQLQAQIEGQSPEKVHESDMMSSEASSRGKTELHFDSGSCSICLETYESDDIVRGLICGHVYHAECVDPWLTRRRACCPICKRDYYKEENASGSANGPVNIEEEAVDAHGNTEGTDQVNTGTTEEGQQAEAADRGYEVVSEGVVGDSSPSQPLETADAANAEETEPANPLQDINFDVIRADSNIQALFNELVPLSERVRVLLEEYPQLDMDARAQEMAKRKYGNIFKIVFWKLMGISKKDLYHWAVIKIYQQEQASSGDLRNNGEEGPTVEPIARNSTEAVEMMEIRRLERLPPRRASAVPENTEEDLAEAIRRRESIEERV